MERIDVTGQTFNKLTAVSYIGNKLYQCTCSCGGSATASSAQLRSGTVKSCGCMRAEASRANGAKMDPMSLVKDIVGQVFNRLTVVSYVGKSFWLCDCACGLSKKVETCHLKSGGTQSCGCLNKEKWLESSQNRIKYEPRIRSAMLVWDNIYNNVGDTVTFEEFLELSQKNCVYCGIVPSKTYNIFLKKKSSQIRRDQGDFTYNGLDRVDNDKTHTIENCVTCCYPCNTAKSYNTLEEFLSRINLLSPKEFNSTTTEIKSKSLAGINKYLLKSIQSIYDYYSKDSDLTIEEFYHLSQENCFYCVDSPEIGTNFNSTDRLKKVSQEARKNAEFKYNGIDRVDSLLDHGKTNIVTCCTTCNYAKNNFSLSSFNAWILRIQEYQKTHNSINILNEKLKNV